MLCNASALLLLVSSQCGSASAFSAAHQNQLDPALTFRRLRRMPLFAHRPPSRRDLLSSAIATLVSSSLLVVPDVSRAIDVRDVKMAEGEEMKMFLDPQGLFALNLPKRFFTIRRTIKGDLPDEKTGSGRRGSSIFTAGDLNKAELLAVERYVHVGEGLGALICRSRFFK